MTHTQAQTVKFKNAIGIETEGKVLSRGFYNVDEPESFLVELPTKYKFQVWVPVSECEVM